MLRAATARCFAGKLGVQSDRVLNAVMNDRMVAKGLVLQWATAFFVDFLATEPMDDLVAILRKVRGCAAHTTHASVCVVYELELTQPRHKVQVLRTCPEAAFCMLGLNAHAFPQL